MPVFYNLLVEESYKVVNEGRVCFPKALRCFHTAERESIKGRLSGLVGTLPGLGGACQGRGGGSGPRGGRCLGKQGAQSATQRDKTLKQLNWNNLTLLK